ncbi:UbiA family prenyltransferase [uncultured Salipiger sp.]|uniref:UbiA family prenyltransferase n=1 Tax=uncultured Salipiger sp. TaxID=499810 RepID=UPI002599F5C7|nr:UbiA family prenyltransferase [uncultured Salipiger sp.]
MTPRTFLTLGRVSNLPTVGTNALAGSVLAGAVDPATVLITYVALTLFYVGGMWLNDAFDAEIDAREKAGRPISCGEVARSTVFAGGAAFLCAGLLIAALLGAWLAGLALAAAILLYDWQHKRTALSPMIMGAARLCCYLLAASAAGGINGTVWVGALGLMAHTAGLTYAARQEAYDRIGSAWPLAMLAVPVLHALVATGGAALAVAIWAGLLAALGVALARLFRRAKGDVPKAVVTMIAAMSLYDAVLIAGAGQGALALIAVAGFGLTLLLQRVVSGT